MTLRKHDQIQVRYIASIQHTTWRPQELQSFGLHLPPQPFNKGDKIYGHSVSPVLETAEAIFNKYQPISKGRAAYPGPLDTNTCLLYTSPSPRDRTRSRMPSSA